MSENVWVTWTCLGVTVPLGINKYIVNTVYEVSKDIKKELKETKRYQLKRLNFKLELKTLNIWTENVNFHT